MNLSVGEVVRPSDSAVLHRASGREYPVMVRGENEYLFDAAGHRYLDASGGGAGVTTIGYGNEYISDVAAKQIRGLQYVHNVRYTSKPQEVLAERLIRACSAGTSRAYFVSGGAEANEAALRAVRSFHASRGDSERTVVIGHVGSYHGATLGTMALSGFSGLHDAFSSWLPPFQHVAPPHCLRCPYGQIAESCSFECVTAFETLAQKVGEHRIAAILVDPIPIASGALTPPESYFQRLRTWCDKIGALLVFDEVVTGMGRCGSYLAASSYNVQPDLISVAKGLGAGYTPIGALLVNERVGKQLIESGGFPQGHSMNGNPVSCAIAGAVLDVLEGGDLVKRSARIGDYLRSALRSELANCDLVVDVRGLGTLIGIEYASDSSTLKFLDEDADFATAVQRHALASDLLVLSGRAADLGIVGDCTVLAPSFTTTDESLDNIVTLVASSVRRAADELSQRT